MRTVGPAVLSIAIVLGGCDAQTNAASSRPVSDRSAQTDDNTPTSAHGIIEPAGTAPQAYAAKEFRQLVAGKTSQEVIAILGAPQSVIDTSGEKTFSYGPGLTYKGPVVFTVRDDDTGKVYGYVSIFFDAAGYVRGVSLS